MDPYRSGGTQCPNCPEVSMREFGTRLVCDNCNGLMMSEADLQAACSDQRGMPLELEFPDEQPTDKPCPRCDQPMLSSHLVVKRARSKLAVLRCSKHGVFLPSKVLGGLFAQLGGGVGGGPSPPTQTGWNPYGSGSATPSNGPATSGLRIGNWADRPRRRPAVTPINVYSDREIHCPVCKTALIFQSDRWTCAQCTGTFLQNEAFVALVEDMSKASWKMPAATGTPGERACPVCITPMLVESLEGVTIDRCDDHGLWFDARELTLALEHASGQFAEHGLASMLHRLFRHGG